MWKKLGLFCLIIVFTLSACSRQGSTSSLPTPLVSDVSIKESLEEWDDFEIYKTSLISSEQQSADLLPNASIYHISIQIADDVLSLEGQESVRYTNQEQVALNEVYFQLFPNMEGGSSTISNILVDGVAVTTTYEDGNAALKVPLATPLEPGQRTVIQMDFQVNLPQDAGGNYGLFGYIDNILVLDGFYPAIPAYDEDGWHEGMIPPNSDTTYQDESFYIVTVTAPQQLVFAASGVNINSQIKKDQQTITFVQGPSRDFYIAASDEFTVLSETIGETTVNSYALKGMEEGQQVALDTAIDCIQSYSSRIGTYPYTEFDVVSTPMSGAYGIEYPGIIGVNYSLYDTTATINNVPSLEWVEFTVAHESGHQWFYSVIGNDQINEPWLDEAMTQYITALYFLDEYGQSGYKSTQGSWYTRWYRVEDLNKPIGLPAESYSGMEYGSIVYGRGPLFVEALSKAMGEETFANFLHVYYETNKWGIATTASFQELAEQTCQCDLDELFDEWVY